MKVRPVVVKATEREAKRSKAVNFLASMYEEPLGLNTEEKDFLRSVLIRSGISRGERQLILG